MKRTAKPTEHQEQVALFAWANVMSARYPELKLMFAIPNQSGGGVPAIIRGRRMVKEGVRAGVPDLLLPVPSGNFHGLFIELKRHGGQMKENQLWWATALRAQGYDVAVCYGFEEARVAIERYLMK